jgi:hypothetical protein
MIFMFEEWGIYDTETRSVLCNIIAKRLVGRSWPTYGDGKEHNENFFEDLQSAARRHGYKINEC